MSDRTFRFHENGQDVGANPMPGTFSQYSTISEHSVVKVDDPVAFNREKAEEFGATHSAASAQEAKELVLEQLAPRVGGPGADHGRGIRSSRSGRDTRTCWTAS